MDQDLQLLTQLRINADYKSKAIKREISDFRKKKRTTSKDALRTKGIVLYYSDKYHEAIRYLNAIVSVEPSERNLTKLAQCQLALKQYRLAHDIGEKALKLFPKSRLAHLILITSLIGLEKYKDAVGLAKAAGRFRDERMRALGVFAKYKMENNDIRILEEIKESSPLFYNILVSTINEFDQTALFRPSEPMTKDDGVIFICGAESAS
jgi:tetratricopeptide (TPR) repeat protein